MDPAAYLETGRPVNCSTVLTIHLRHRAVSAVMTDSATGRTQPLPLPVDEMPSTEDLSPRTLIAVATVRATVAGARDTGVITGPDVLVITYPHDWGPEQVRSVHESAADAGFAPDRITVVRAPA